MVWLISLGDLFFSEALGPHPPMVMWNGDYDYAGDDADDGLIKS